MTDEQAFFAALVAIYLAECVVWVRRDALLLRPRPRRPPAPVAPSPLAGNAVGGLVPLLPLPLRGGALICRQAPLSISPRGVSAWVAQNLHDAVRAPRSGAQVDFAALGRADAALGELRVDGARLAHSLPTWRARELAGRIEELAALAPEQREGAIEADLRGAFDLGAIRGLAARHAAACGLVAPWCNVLFVLVFAALPAMVWARGVVASAPFLLLGLLPAWLGTLAAFACAHRRLHPGRRRERWARCAGLALMPPAAIRAQDLLDRELLAAHDPLAVVVALCEREDARRFARRALRDLRHPSPLGAPELGPEAAEIEAWFRARLVQVAEETLREAGFDLEALARAPEPENGCASWCPRCERQYELEAGDCYECGVALEPFAVTPVGAS